MCEEEKDTRPISVDLLQVLDDELDKRGGRNQVGTPVLGEFDPYDENSKFPL